MSSATLHERSCSDPQAHEARRQGGVRDFPRGRDCHRLVRGRLRAAGAREVDAGPTVIIGTKNFPEEFILGQLYKQALEAKGFTVSYKENIGSTELIQTSLTSGKINLYPEYTGVIVQDVFHHTLVGQDGAAATYAAREAARGGEGLHASSSRRRSSTPTWSR